MTTANELQCLDNTLLEPIRKETFNIFYISDIHLDEKISHATNKNSKFIILQNVKRLLKPTPPSSVLVIAGDVSHNYEVFKIFVQTLSAEINQTNIKVIFTLGNHELWPFSAKPLTNIIRMYRALLKKYSMYLLQNNVIAIDADNSVFEITEKQITEYTVQRIKEKCITAKLIFFGGIAFSGFNKEFNATLGLYGDVINTEEEDINQSNIFYNLYEKLYNILVDKRAIIVTHTPIADWNKNEKIDSNIIYIYGHTHRNYQKENIYADAQIGRGRNAGIYRCTPKKLIKRTAFWVFEKYSDGVHEIPRNEYVAYFGEPLHYIGDIFMIKKNGYYAFLYQNPGGKFCLLNGAKGNGDVHYKDLNKFYEDFDILVQDTIHFLYPFTLYQENIAKRVKEIGGTGRIHGAIIDIDSYNHIIINPQNSKLICYAATSMVDKVVYPDFMQLLKDQRPELLNNSEASLTTLAEIQNNSIVPIKNKQPYGSTRMYTEYSNLIVQYQKLATHKVLVRLPLTTNDANTAITDNKMRVIKP